MVDRKAQARLRGCVGVTDDRVSRGPDHAGRPAYPKTPADNVRPIGSDCHRCVGISASGLFPAGIRQKAGDNPSTVVSESIVRVPRTLGVRCQRFQQVDLDWRSQWHTPQDRLWHGTAAVSAKTLFTWRHCYKHEAVWKIIVRYPVPGCWPFQFASDPAGVGPGTR